MTFKVFKDKATFIIFESITWRVREHKKMRIYSMQNLYAKEIVASSFRYELPKKLAVKKYRKKNHPYASTVK